MTYFWHHDALLTSWCIFDVMMNFLMSWRILSRGKCFVVMTYFLTSWCNFWRHVVIAYFWRRHDILFDVMTKYVMLWRFFNFMTYFLTSWCTFWRHDTLFEVMTYFLKSWHIFDVMTYFWRYVVFLTSWHTFWRHGINFDIMSIFDIMTYSRHIFLTSWPIHLFTSRHFVMSWRIFDIMKYFWTPCRIFEVVT